MLSDWSVDGPAGLALTLLTVCAGLAYLAAAARGRRRDRRGRRWPFGRSACWLAGLGVLIVDLDSAIGAGADTHLADHMLEHMVMWVVVAPLLVAAAPIRLALFALDRGGRRRLGHWLRSRPVRLLTGPAGSVALFSAVMLAGQVPAVYALTEANDLVHVAEHALFVLTAMLVWAPVLGADPLPHRPGTGELAGCLVACMVPMLAVAGWLLAAGAPLYAACRVALGAGPALHDQRIAGLVMALGAIPAFGLTAAALAHRLPLRRAVALDRRAARA